ncbi:hypothetical protein SKAU_G00114220 [Synaphobranchus kaupii]|uniref:Uncharacterized protein n=1 Tax=Synaphobranchus kaupii TaxID=118154 RepID=A0A9Q1G0S6_SYNKA|nr:hypothetical protein SKAU_G00114220 [Synaphobranchus kaupii]
MQKRSAGGNGHKGTLPPCGLRVASVLRTASTSVNSPASRFLPKTAAWAPRGEVDSKRMPAGRHDTSAADRRDSAGVFSEARAHAHACKVMHRTEGPRKHRSPWRPPGRGGTLVPDCALELRRAGCQGPLHLPSSDLNLDKDPGAGARLSACTRASDPLKQLLPLEPPGDQPVSARSSGKRRLHGDTPPQSGGPPTEVPAVRRRAGGLTAPVTPGERGIGGRNKRRSATSAPTSFQ